MEVLQATRVQPTILFGYFNLRSFTMPEDLISSSDSDSTEVKYAMRNDQEERSFVLEHIGKRSTYKVRLF